MFDPSATVFAAHRDPEQGTTMERSRLPVTSWNLANSHSLSKAAPSEFSVLFPIRNIPIRMKEKFVDFSRSAREFIWGTGFNSVPVFPRGPVRVPLVPDGKYRTALQSDEERVSISKEAESVSSGELYRTRDSLTSHRRRGICVARNSRRT